MKLKINKKSIVAMIALLFTILFESGCKKLVDIGAPVTSLNEENVFADETTATATLTNIYAQMSRSTGVLSIGDFTGNMSLSMLCGLSADEFALSNEIINVKLQNYYQNSLISDATQSDGSEHWATLYQYIFKCNAIIEGLNKSTILTASVRQQLLGEAKFLRAFCYFYLVNLFGDVPLAVQTDPAINAKLARSSADDVYRLIKEDLIDAQGLLSPNFLDGKLKPYSERLRPNRSAATALLSRVYLYKKEYASAEMEATNIINNTSIFALTSLNDVFLKNSKEAIWQLQPVSYDRNTEDAWAFIVPLTGFSDVNPVYLNEELTKQFEVTDQRKSLWIRGINLNGKDYLYPYKYKSATMNVPVTEYLMVFRLAEQYLIRAEARARLNKLSEAGEDLNAIRGRAGLGNIFPGSQEAMINAVLKERQVELFTEWGHRWLDLKRMGNIDAVMTVVTPKKGGTWKSTQQLFPILFGDIQKNPNLKQNPGY